MADQTWPPEVAHLPVDPHRNLPVPFVAEIDADGAAHFTILDDTRARECVTGRLCGMCGLPMGPEVALLGDVVSLDPGGLWIEPPVHERCAEIALGGLCPFISRERVPRRPPEDNVALVGMDDPDEITAIGRTIAKRPMIMAVTGTYRPVMTPNHVGGLTMLYQAGRIIRVRRYAWADGRAAEVLAPPARHVRIVRTQPRKRPRSRR